MPHLIQTSDVFKHTKSISDTKKTQVSNLQNHIQEILGSTHHTFLQGSYKNTTSISDINDVDIIAVRLSTYSSVHSGKRFSESIPWDTIFSEIEQKLKNQKLYIWTVSRKDKCIEVRTGTFKADIVPAVQVGEDHTVDPVAIYSFKDGVEKKNSPRLHHENGVAKHDATNQNYKPIVRMFKNWVANHFGDNSPVSSYHMESLVYGSPNDIFGSDHATSFFLVTDHIDKVLKQRDSLLFPIMSVCGTEDITLNWNIIDQQRFREKLGESLVSVAQAYRATTSADAKSYWDRAFNV
jgi:hypothetical protein